MYLLLLCFGALLAAGAFLILSDLLNVPTLATEKAVLTVSGQTGRNAKSTETLIWGLAEKLSKLIRMDGFKRRKLAAQLKAADIRLTPETYLARAWVKAGLIALLILPVLLILPLLTPVVLFLAVAVWFREIRQADEIVRQKREEIEAELPRFVSTIAQELKASRDVLNILTSYRKNAGPTMTRELSVTIADMASGNEETALTRWEIRIGSTMLSDAVRGLIAVLRGDNGVTYFEMLSMTFKQLELQRLKLTAMKQPGRIHKYSFYLLGCFLLIYFGILGYEIMHGFGKLF